MKKSRKFRDNRVFIVSRIIIDREYDIPVEIYDEVDDSVLSDLMFKYPGHELIKNQYKTNKNMQDFFKFVRDVRRRTDKSVYLYNELSTEPNAIFRYLAYTDKDWEEYISYNLSLDHNLLQIITTNILEIIDEPMFHNRLEFVVKLLRKSMKYQNNKSFMDFMQKFFVYHNVKDITEIAYMIGCNKHYDETMHCLESGIPVLYKDGSPSTIFMYLETVMESNYNGVLDDVIVKQMIPYRNNDDVEFNKMCEMIHDIGVTLNHKNLKYYYIVGQYSATENAIVSDISKTKMDSFTKIDDFGDIIQILGEKNSGLSTNLQKSFLENGGDIETMFDENGRLYPEASILRLSDQLSTLLKILDIEQIRFLLLNCPEFTKNVMVSTEFSLPEYTKIARALLVYPIDTELYDILNPEELSGTTDYRAYIINLIITGITKNVLFNTVPESMAYIEPSVSYIVENLTYDTVKFVPLHRIVHSIKQIIARDNKYQRFNLYEDGKYVSILTAVDNDIEFMINEIAKSGQYGYICDLMSDNTSRLIDIFAEMKTR
mgnify:CR=1 FL=1